MTNGKVFKTGFLKLCSFIFLLYIFYLFKFDISSHQNLLMNLFQKDNHPHDSQFAIYIENIDSKWNFDANKCAGCSCQFNKSDSLEPLIHCIIEKSPFITNKKTDSTFIFVPFYTNNLRKKGIENTIQTVSQFSQTKTDAFYGWHGCRHLQVDSLLTMDNNISYMQFNQEKKNLDQHIFITTNMTIEYIRSNRWMNSRHILIPPLQMLKEYRESSNRPSQFLFLGNTSIIKSLHKNFSESILIDSFQNKEKLFDAMSKSIYTVFQPDETFLPFFIYEILRSNSIPVLISGPFLPAYANTHINYSQISIRIDPKNISSFDERIKKFDKEKALKEISRIKQFLMWPLDGIATKTNAAGVLLDYLNTRYKVLRPVLRRTFIGSDKLLP